MAARRKARKPTTRRAATGTAKIRVHTDEYGRKVYTVVGTKKYAYTLAKAKELAAKKAPKKRASSKKSTALTTTRKRTTVAKRKPTTRRRTTGAKRNAKGQFVKAGRKTAGAGARYRGRGGKRDSRFKGFDGLEMDEPMTAAERRAVLAKAEASNRRRRTTRRNTSQSARLSQALDDRMFEVSVGVDRRVGMGKPLSLAKRTHTLASGRTVVSKRTRGVDKYETLVEFYREVRGRAAAIAVAEDAMRGAVPDYHRHVYREDKDHGKDAGAVAWRPKRDAGGEYRIHAYIDPIYE